MTYMQLQETAYCHDKAGKQLFDLRALNHMMLRYNS